MNNITQKLSLAVALIALSVPTTTFATGNGYDEHEKEHHSYNPPPKPTPTPTPQVTMPINVKIEPTVTGTINQRVEIEQTAITNSGDIRNSATGGKVEIEKGAFQNSVTGGKATIEEGAVKNTNTNTATAKGGEGGKAESNATVGPITINNGSSEPERALVLTPPDILDVPAIPAPASFYPQGVPNSVGSAGLVNAYENHCAIQISGDNNVVRSDTGHEKIIAVFDDQARMGGTKTTPEVRIVKGPQQLAPNSGRCYCLGTLQVESTIKPDEARENNMQTIHAAAGKFARNNLRGFKQVQLVYVPNQSVTFQKGTAAHAGSAGIGGAVSAIISASTMGAVSPSLGMTNGYTTDYPISGVTYLIVGSVDGDAPLAGARTVDISLLMNQVEKMPTPQAWGSAPSPQVAHQAEVATPPEVKQ